MRKILIAEDNTELSDMMRNYLIKAGHSVYQAFNGAQALEYARSMQPETTISPNPSPSRRWWAG